MLFNILKKEDSNEEVLIRIRIDATGNEWEILRDAIVGKITIGLGKDCRIYTSRSKAYCNWINFIGTKTEKEVVDNYISDILETMEETERLRLA